MKKFFAAALGLAGAAALAPAANAQNIFLDMGIEGGAQNAGFEDQIALMSFSFGLGIDEGKKYGCQFDEVGIVKGIDEATAEIVTAAALGSAFDNATLTVVRNTGDFIAPVLVLKLSKVVVSDYTTGAREGAGGPVVERASLRFESASGTAYTQNFDGTVDEEEFQLPCF